MFCVPSAKHLYFAIKRKRKRFFFFSFYFISMKLPYKHEAKEEEEEEKNISKKKIHPRLSCVCVFFRFLRIE